MDPTTLTQIGPYAVLRYLAEGGMAWVFEVQDYRFERSLALKVLKPRASEGRELELFEQEAQLLGAINHPNVVQIFDHGRDDASGLFYYTMTLVRGPSLRDLAVERGGLDVETAGQVFEGVLAGLAEIHARNVVHRDITPRNILVEEGSRAVLMDLGIARRVEEEDSDGTVYTRVIAGTPMYMSPEQSAGHRPTRASDIFSLGLTFYFALTGHSVYDTNEQVDSRNSHSVRDYLGYLKHARQEIQLEFPRHVPRRLREVVRRALRLDPKARYADASEMRDALREALQPRRELPSWLPLAGGVAAGALLIALLAAALLGGDEAPPVPAAEPVRQEPASTGQEPAPVQQAVAPLQAAPAPGVPDDAGPAEPAVAPPGSSAEPVVGAEPAGGPPDVAGDRQAASEALARAGSLLGRAERLAEAGLEIDPGHAPVLLSRARQDFEAGRFDEAADTASRAGALLEATVPDNVPPARVSRAPEEPTLAVQAGEGARFEVVASDVDEDALSYAWTVGGQARQGDGGRLELAKLDEDTEVAVRVDDGRGGVLEERWQVDVNRAPGLRVSPRSRSVRLTPGAGQEFVAKASDGDGDPLTTVVLLDGVEVARGTAGDTAYRFEAGEEGHHELVFEARDDHGASQRETRTIQVSRAPAPPPTPPPPRGPRGELVRTLRDWERAFEACQVDRVRGLRQMTPQDVRTYQELCREYSPKVLVDPRPTWGEDGASAWLCITHELVFRSAAGDLPWKRRGLYRADFVKRPDGWQIIDVRAGCEGEG